MAGDSEPYGAINYDFCTLLQRLKWGQPQAHSEKEKAEGGARAPSGREAAGALACP